MTDVSASNDLISRTELLNDLSYCAPELWQDEQYIKAKIMKQPAVDAEPVRYEQVKPVIDIDTWACGNCGHTLEHQELLGDNVLFHEYYNYCPECGKKVKWND